MAEVSVVVVTYDALPWIEQCLESVRDVPTIVVDNGSSDGTVAFVRERFPEVEVIESENRGLAAGWNTGLAGDGQPLRASPERAMPGSSMTRSARLVDGADSRPTAAFVAPRLSNPDGTLQRSVRGFPTLWRLATEYLGLRKLAPRSTALNAFYAGGFDHDEVRIVESVMGACMLVRRAALAEFGFADESFFLFSEETDWHFRARRAGWDIVFLPDAECVHVRGASHAGRLFRENLRGHLRFFRKHRGARQAEWARRLLVVALRMRGAIFRSERGTRIAMRRRGFPPETWRSSWNGDQHRALCSAALRDRARPGSGLGARPRSRRPKRLGHSRLVADARLRRARSLLCGRILSHACDRAARCGRPHGGGGLVRPEECGSRADSLALGGGRRRWCPRDRPVVGRGLGSGRRPLPSRASTEDPRARRALVEGGRRVRGREPAPGYAFPLWHGFLALVSRLSGAELELVVLHLPSILAVLAIAIAYEAGWALFRSVWAAGAVAGAQAGMICFAPGSGGAYAFLSLPATSSRQLLVPAALALALSALRLPSRALLASTAAAGLVLAVVHPTYAIFLWIPFVGFLLVRALWTRQDLRPGGAALAALALPAAFFMLWLIPIVADTGSVSPDRDEVRRAFEQYPGQLDIRSETSYSLAAEVFTRSGPVAIAALLLIPLAAFAARRRWSAFVVGGSLAVFAFMLVPLLFTTLADLVSISQARRAAGFLPFAFAFAGGLGVLSRVLWPWLPPVALVAGAALQYVYPGDFDYALDDPGPSWVVWIAVVGSVAALIYGFVRRGRPPVEDAAGLAAALFLLPVVAVGLAKWDPRPTPPLGLLSEGLVQAVREKVPERSVVYSDQETSFRIAAFAPVYIAVAPPGHVADTMVNRPFERAREAREFLRTGDLAIPRRYEADYLVVDRARGRRDFELPELYRDVRFVLYRLP